MNAQLSKWVKQADVCDYQIFKQLESKIICTKEKAFINKLLSYAYGF